MIKGEVGSGSLVHPVLAKKSVLGNEEEPLL